MRPPGFEPGSLAREAKFSSEVDISKRGSEELKKGFKEFCLIDLSLSERTVSRHLVVIRDFLKFMENPDISQVGREDIRRYLKNKRDNEARGTYANRIKALRRFFRDFLDSEELIKSFRIPKMSGNNDTLGIPDKAELQKFFGDIDMDKYGFPQNR